jgi:ubiquinone biosynthesis protein
MHGLRLALRFVQLAWLVGLALLGYVGARLVRGRMTTEARERLRGIHLASLLERLGATYLKFGQILSTRPDLIGPGYIEALSRLQDRVKPESSRAIFALLDAELGEKRARFVELSEEPIAAASVAQVHKGVLDDGSVVAVKIQRPGVEERVARDLALLRIFAGLTSISPTLRLMAIPGAVERFGQAMEAQLDFCKEAENNLRFAANIADLEGVEVPRLYPELCTKRVLTMEFIEGVRATEPEKVGHNGRELAMRGLDAILTMVFRDAFVHADLHPGNILLTQDGRVVLIDLGLVAEIEDDMRKPWIDTFMALMARDGRGTARLFYAYAPSVGVEDYASYEDDVSAFFDYFHGKQLSEMEGGQVITGMMNILRKHRVAVDPVYTVVHVAMVVAEGLGKQLAPELDLIQLAGPRLMEAMVTCPPGRAPLREPPSTEGIAA